PWATPRARRRRRPAPRWPAWPPRGDGGWPPSPPRTICRTARADSDRDRSPEADSLQAPDLANHAAAALLVQKSGGAPEVDPGDVARLGDVDGHLLRRRRAGQIADVEVAMIRLSFAGRNAVHVEIEDADHELQIVKAGLLFRFAQRRIDRQLARFDVAAHLQPAAEAA